MTSDGSFKVRALTSSNYFSWRREMEAYLITRDLWDGVEENGVHIADAQKNVKSRKACAHLIMCTTEKLRGLIPPNATGKQAWEALQAFGLRRAAERKTDLHRRFTQVTQGSGEKVAEFILRAEEVRGELVHGCGEQVTDDMMMGILLNGVSSGFATTIEALQCQSGLALDTLKEKLMGAEARKLLEGPQDAHWMCVAVLGSQECRSLTGLTGVVATTAVRLGI